jgi:hypothetical protein
MSTEKHVHLLGILHIVHSSLVLLLGLGIFMLMVGIGIISRDQDAALVLGIIGTLVAGLMVFISIPGIVGGIGLLKLKPWGRILTLIVGILKLLDIPIGTALGVYTIWVLMREDVEKLFNRTSVPDTVPVPAPPQQQWV